MPDFKKMLARVKKPDFSRLKNMKLSDVKKLISSTKFLVWSVASFILLSILVMIVTSCTPPKGNILYGMCAKFLELQVEYPTSVQHKDIELYPKGTRIYYTHVDSYGDYRVEYIECTFEQDPVRGVQLEDVFFNYIKPATFKERLEDKGRIYQARPDVIQLFNQSNSAKAILEDIDLSIPEGANVYRY
jgi:hypothetical protein